ncbi:MAG: MFS transporter, partial [Caldilineaceae bacterium]|nr:MFS transporter [Caldilineaceae bacterium]
MQTRTDPIAVSRSEERPNPTPSRAIATASTQNIPTLSSDRPASRLDRVARIPRELKLFIGASLALGVAYSMFDATFNNFLDERFALTGFQRSFLEFPRELPGFLVVFVSALLWFLCSRRLGAASLLLGVAGALTIGFAAPTYAFLVVWLFVYSLGQHMFMPLSSTIGMELAREGQTGQRLGQLNAVRNFAAIVGSFTVVIGFRYLHFSFQFTFLLVALALAVAVYLMFSMRPTRPQRPKTFFTLHREYNLFYVLNILSGSRKQIFITFAPWVLVTIFQQPTQIIATLMMVGGIIGVVFQPILGWTIDRFGERAVLAAEALILIPVCFGYGFSKSIFADNIAFIIVCACFLLDQMLMSVGMARSTYMKKIALQPDDVQPALTMAVSIDHVFSITAALVGGLIWSTFGFQYVFLMGSVIAVV